MMKSVLVGLLIGFLAMTFINDLDNNWMADLQDVKQVMDSVNQYQIELYDRYDEAMDRIEKLESLH